MLLSSSSIEVIFCNTRPSVFVVVDVDETQFWSVPMLCGCPPPPPMALCPAWLMWDIGCAFLTWTVPEPINTERTDEPLCSMQRAVLDDAKQQSA